ncbi:hypothetical protein X915_gp016 [Bacillus phage vB_BanS-Tsamsa]|uniref:DUF3862 domain-containing protein n=1 Tax=Bacillus phage vB_BanS-Tsamsa TaxID=1308863 RepID=U5J9H5_9CAUD|nr:hypothetical protein X915_gp016 [Bacillus phage vB_BanS-Tsamsa]AGI11848.1 hypothetical protein [Bacillus phage vB_BanS-Tsamsa]
MMKRTLIGLVVGLSFLLVAVACTDTEVKKESKQVQKKESKPEPKQEAPKNDGKITKTEFDAVQSGMTYEEVVAIIGSEGEMLSEVGSKGEQFHSVMYEWKGTGDFGANANFTFQEGKMEMKAQFGLK